MAVNLFESWLKNKWVHHGLRFSLAALITMLLFPFQLDLLEYTAYDWRMKLSPRAKPSGHIVLLSIEHDTAHELGRDPEALDWAVVLQKLAQANPAQVVSFVNPNSIQGSFEDLSLLSEVMQRLPFQFGENDLPKSGAMTMDPLPAPFENIPVAAAPKTADKAVKAKDGVTRRLILTYENQFTMHPRLAQAFNGIANPSAYKGAFDFIDSTQMMIRYRPKGAYPTIRFIDAIKNPISSDQIKGKIVLIGRDTLDIAADYVTTPLSKDVLALSQLEMHANILDTLIQNKAPRFSPDWVKLFFTYVISLLTIYIVLSARPAKGLFMLASTVLVFLAIALSIFAGFDWVIPVAHPLMAVFICYYFVIPYRLIVENRRSWEYYQRNRLLTQVEELKSNFMRMMSHDLKTPLARIQGMADVIRKDSRDLSQTQLLALDSISESSEELTEFIGSILSLSRIESKEMKLQVRSRDVNQILRQAKSKAEYLATRKNIEIVMELEPLFSIKVDEDLLKTVFTNLLENAVKYSPENTKILVSTDEIDNDVVIQIADQGRGIPVEDQTLIFDRFYRARNSRSNTAGNGLGLYLAKYFVELHNGRIEVESEVEKGSTFTVRLPMNLNTEMDHFEGGVYV